jgi:hypothetical protein
MIVSPAAGIAIPASLLTQACCFWPGRARRDCASCCVQRSWLVFFYEGAAFQIVRGPIAIFRSGRDLRKRRDLGSRRQANLFPRAVVLPVLWSLVALTQMMHFIAFDSERACACEILKVRALGSRKSVNACTARSAHLRES